MQFSHCKSVCTPTKAESLIRYKRYCRVNKNWKNASYEYICQRLSATLKEKAKRKIMFAFFLMKHQDNGAQSIF